MVKKTKGYTGGLSEGEQAATAPPLESNLGLLLPVEFSNINTLMNSGESEKEYQDRINREYHDKEAQDKANREAQDKANRESSDKEARDKEARDRESRDKESSDKEARDRESRDRESSDKEARDKEARDKEARDRESRDRESRDKANRESREKAIKDATKELNEIEQQRRTLLNAKERLQSERRLYDMEKEDRLRSLGSRLIPNYSDIYYKNQIGEKINDLIKKELIKESDSNKCS